MLTHTSKDEPPKFSSIPICVKLIGAQQLPISNLDTYCVIQYGSRSIHRTKPFAPKVSKTARLSRALRINRLFGVGSAEQILQKSLQNPIWTTRED